MQVSSPTLAWHIIKRIDIHLCLSCVSGLLQLAKEALPYWGQIQTEKHYRPEMLQLKVGSPLEFLKGGTLWRAKINLA